ncbi:MAG: hypothetical protein HY000_39445 [Planctomycetes bacterium]|nr:hypothetical protein [Planctomycetota bacterium]
MSVMYGARRASRRGATVVLVAICVVALGGVLAFAVDIGYLCLARTQLQSAADAAALAGAANIADDGRLVNTTSGNSLLPPPMDKIRTQAQRYSELNTALNRAVTLATNADNALDGDIVIGQFTNPADLDEQLSLANPSSYNTVYINGRMTQERNGAVPLFFARLFGMGETGVSVVSAATVWSGVSGFDLSGSDRLDLLPFAVKQSEWNRIRFDGQGRDDFAWDPATQSVQAGSDGIRELSIFPNDTTSGNFGTVDIGDPNNSTSDLIRQIRDGLTAADLAWHGGELKLNPSTGTLLLNGDTGISAATKDALSDLIGQKRILPLYSTVQGNGNNATYTIVGFAGVRIMGVRLTGAKKALVVQMANVMSRYAIVDPNVQLPNNLVYTTPRLSR